MSLSSVFLCCFMSCLSVIPEVEKKEEEEEEEEQREEEREEGENKKNVNNEKNKKEKRKRKNEMTETVTHKELTFWELRQISKCVYVYNIYAFPGHTELPQIPISEAN